MKSKAHVQNYMSNKIRSLLTSLMYLLWIEQNSPLRSLMSTQNATANFFIHFISLFNFFFSSWRLCVFSLSTLTFNRIALYPHSRLAIQSDTSHSIEVIPGLLANVATAEFDIQLTGSKLLSPRRFKAISSAVSSLYFHLSVGPELPTETSTKFSEPSIWISCCCRIKQQGGNMDEAQNFTRSFLSCC